MAKDAKAVFKKIFGDKAESIQASLKEFSPEFARHAIDFPFGEFYAHDDLLDLRTRELVTISTLITQGTLPQLKIHFEGALNVGCTETEIEQVIMQLIIYVGMPRVINAYKTFKEVLAERKTKSHEK